MAEPTNPSLNASVRRCIPGLLLGLAFSLGCANETPPTSLAGTAKFADEPIAEGTLRLRPIEGVGGPGAGGNIKAGKYSIASSKGLVPGEYWVSVSAWRDTGVEIPNPEQREGEPAKIAETVQYIPTNYNGKSTLRLVLEAGANEHDFVLEDNRKSEGTGEDTDKDTDDSDSDVVSSDGEHDGEHPDTEPAETKQLETDAADADTSAEAAN